MIALINCGGSGSRLWPLSTPDFPKHLLTVSEDGGRSLLQSTYDRTKGMAEHIYFITEAGHAHHVKEQLPEVDEDHIIIEPARRGTASCLLIALDHIAERHNPDEPMVFMHSDHVINDVKAFHDSVSHAAAVSAVHGAITLLGVEPTYPSTGFGYIEKGERISAESAKDVFRVATFKEKPDRQTAEGYVKAGNYLWNMGYFAAPLNVFVETMKSDAPELHGGYESLRASEDKRQAYLDLEDMAIDYALMEPARELLVVPGNFDWVDVGSFQDLHTISPQDDDGNAITGKGVVELEDVSNSYIANKNGLNVAVIGLDNVAVVVTDDGVLVTNRNHAQHVGTVSKRFAKKGE